MAEGTVAGGRSRRLSRWLLGGLALLSLLLPACSGQEPDEVVYGRVTADEVVETVAAPATIQPAGRVTVMAPATGEVAELSVEDGDRVERGDVLLRLTSGSVADRVAQAEAAVRAADQLSGVSAGADLSPLLAAVGTQLDAVLPDLLDALAAEAGELGDGPLRRGLRERIRAVREDYRRVRGSLARAERELEAGATAATASQREAAAAQREQAEVALEAARRQARELTVTAPSPGIVELVRGTAGGSGGPAGLEAGGGLPDQLAGLPGVGSGTSRDGPVAVGAEVRAGEPLLRVLDLSGFHAEADVDEIDAVDVAVGQPATVLVDAHRGRELSGTVRHVALSPRQGATGGVVYPTVVALEEVPSDVRLLAGLTASVEIEVRRVDADTVVPSAALRRSDGRDVVRVVRDGEVVAVPVEVVASGAETAAVEPRGDGELSRGERVVVTGLEEETGDGAG